MVLKITTGYSPDYLLKEVAKGRESYYTGAVAEGEPPGRWWGAGAEKLGLTGLVDAQDMRALYERFLDPREDGFRDPQRWDEVYTLGHAGRAYKSEDDLYTEALEREPGASPERRAELRTQAGKGARHNVAFYDITFNVQKSVTLIHTAFEAKEVAARRAGDLATAEAWAQFRTAVEDAIWAGNNAGLTYMQDHAGYTRIGHHGGAAGRWADAHAWTVASFFQHDSREHDPHLHIHNAVHNRVEGPNGEWLTIDSKALYKFRAAGAAVCERTTEERITHALGVLLAMRPDGKAREVVGVAQEAMDLISTRRRKLTAKADELIGAFEERHGRAPTALERDRIAQQATLLTRKAKSHTGETREQLLDRIDARIQGDLDSSLGAVADMVLAARGQAAPVAMEWSPRAVIETAIADVQSRMAKWNRGDLTGAINAALPDYLGLPDGEDVGELLDSLTEAALEVAAVLNGERPGDASLPDELRLANGASSYQAPGGTLYASPEQVRIERALVAATTRGGATALPPDRAARFLEDMETSGIRLGLDQAAAVHGVLTSGARVETLIGPAGTGKSFVVGTIARAWTDPSNPGAQMPRRVFGLATSQIATEVLAAEGLTARNVAAWLGTQRRLSAGAGSGGPRPVAGDEAWRLHAGDLVVVDESAMTDTADLAAIHDRVDTAGAKLLLVGDHRQLAAIGAGGAMDLLSQSGARYELTEARRFTHEWEREASLRLRAGDESVLRVYHQQGRLIDGGTIEQAEQLAIRGWLGDTLAGRRALLIVDTNEQAARVSAQVRHELVQLGLVQEQGVALGLQGTFAGVGDLVEARQLDWSLAGHEGNPRGAINREHYRVHAIRDDGSLEVAAILGRTPDGDVLGDRLVLPAAYVAEHLALGYASTKNAAQGSTVHGSHTVTTARTSPAGLYMPLTRGQDANTAYVVTVAEVEDPAQGDHRHTVYRDPVAVLARILDTTDQVDATNRSAVATAAEHTEHAGSARTAAELFVDAAQLAATERTGTWLDQLVDTGAITAHERERIAAEDGAATLTRILRRAEIAGHDPHHVLHDAVTASSLDGARNLSNVLYSRIRTEYADRLDPVGDTFTDWTPRLDNPAWSTYLADLAKQVEHRAGVLADDAAHAGAEAPGWAVEAFGPVPDAPEERERWARQVGQVAVYREIRDHTTDTDPLGAAPGSGQVEQYAAYRTAWHTLGRPETRREVMELTDGQLRIRVRAAEREEKAGPRYVANELAGTRQAATTHRHTAELRAAKAQAATDPEQQARLRAEVAQARALADTLDRQAEQLQIVDDARGRWLVHSAVTRVDGADAAAELGRRYVDDTEPEPRVTADDWLDAHRAATTADDAHRPITDTDLHDDEVRLDVGALDQPTPDRGTLDQDVQDAVLETPPADLREIAAAEPAPVDEDRVRVPTSGETAESTSGAHRVLAEIRARETIDAREEAEYQRAEELTRWHHDDNTAGHDTAGYGDNAGYDDADVLDDSRDPAGTS